MSTSINIHRMKKVRASHNEEIGYLRLLVEYEASGYDTDDGYSYIQDSTEITMFCDDTKAAKAIADAINSAVEDEPEKQEVAA